MKIKLIVTSALVMLLASAGSAWAAGPKTPEMAPNRQPTPVIETTEVEPVRAQEREMTQTRDASGTQSLVQAREQERERDQIQQRDQTQSTTATMRRSAVANAVQEMLRVADRVGGIGEQVRTIAQAQNQDQEQLEARLKKIEERGRVAKFFLGANYSEIRDAEKIIEQNRLRIQQLNEIKSQITNSGDQQALTEQISTLEQESSQTEDSLKRAQKGFSLLGWMFRLFAK